MHERTANTPAAWEATADSLLAAAKVLRSYRDTFEPQKLKVGDPIPDGWKVGAPELLLRGLAMECMLKAALAKRRAVVVKGKLIAEVRHHDLVRLADRLGVKLNAKEKHLLKRLTAFIEYGGRYPIPVRAEDHLRLERVPGGGRAVLTYWAQPSDDKLFADLLARIETLALG